MLVHDSLDVPGEIFVTGGLTARLGVGNNIDVAGRLDFLLDQVDAINSRLDALEIISDGDNIG